MSNQVRTKLVKLDSELEDVFERYEFFLSEIDRLEEARDINGDTLDDTRSYDINIQKYEHLSNEAAFRINFACNELGMKNLLEFII